MQELVADCELVRVCQALQAANLSTSAESAGGLHLVLLLQLVVLWLVRRWRPRPAERFELLCLAISLPDAIASARVRHRFEQCTFHHCSQDFRLSKGCSSIGVMNVSVVCDGDTDAKQ